MLALVYSVRPVQWTVCKVAGWLRPGVFWSRLAWLRYARVPVPPLPTPRWVRLRTTLGGICGTDVAGIMQRHHPASILQAFSSFPAVLGHENVAVVDEVGPAVNAWKPGDRVVVEPSLSCVPRGIEPLCPSCAAGRFTLCDNFRTGPLPVGSMIGWNNFTGGSWSPYFVAHESQLHRVPDAIGDEEAVLTDPIAGALHAVMRCTPADGQAALIVGGGLLGMGVAGAIRALGSRCRLVALVRHRHQEERLRRFGADDCILTGRKGGQGPRYAQVAERVGGRVVPTRFGHHAFTGGFDIVFDCVGTGASLTDCLKYARSGGKVVEVGTSSITPVDTAPIWFNEIDLLGANGRAGENYQGRRLHTYELLWELMLQGRIDLRGLLTHQFRPDQYRQAFAALANRNHTGAIKVAFRP